MQSGGEKMKNIKKVFCLILVGVMMITITGCGAQPDAEAAFLGMMEALQTGEVETINTYYNFEEISRFLEAENQETLLGAVFQTLQNMDYEISSVEKIDGANVKITAKVSTLDFSKVLGLFLEEMITLTATPEYQAKVPQMKAEEYQQMLAEIMIKVLQNPNIPQVEKTATITMVKQDGKWIPGGDKNEFFSRFFGNVIQTINSLL